MEDAKEHPHDSGDNIQEPISKAVGNKVKSKGEKFPSHATLAGDAKSENGENDSEKFRNETKSKTTIKSDMEDQVIPMGGAVEPENALGSVGEHVNFKSENKDTLDSKIKSKEPTGDENAVKKQIDKSTELIEPNAIEGEVNGEISPENSMEDENHVKNVMEEKLNEEISEEIPNFVEDVSMEENNLEDGAARKDLRENIQIPTDIADNRTQTQSENAVLGEVLHGEDEEMEDADPDKTTKDDLKEQKEVILASADEAATPNSLVRYPPSKVGDYSDQIIKPTYTHTTLPLMAEDDDGTPEEQTVFMKEIERIYRERGLEFKPPKFYGQPLNCLKLWRAVIRLGGYERVTGSKLWRQVGESFHPPKTCTTVSWTFRIFYEKSLLEYEKYKIQSDELQLPVATLPEASGVDKEVFAQGNGHQHSEPGRVRRDAAARAMQGWHSQRNGRIGEPVVKNKNLNSSPKCKKNFKSIGSLKQKRPNELETSNKVARTEISEQLVASVIDVGPPADWVKVNVCPTADCFEVYALVPGLLREEVRVQSDPAGCLVITGQPEQVDNPWGVTSFKKVVSLPSRIDPLNTSAVVSLHGGLFVRVPYEQ